MKTKQLKREEERSAKKGRTLQNTHQNYEVNYDRKTTDRTRHGHLTSHPRLDGRSCSQTQWKEICRDKHRAIQLGFSRSLLDMDYHVAHGTPHRIRSFHRSPSPPCSHSSCYQATRSRNVRFNKLADSPNLTPNRTKKITQFTFLTSSCITKQSPRCRYTIRQGSLRDDMNPNKNQA